MGYIGKDVHDVCIIFLIYYLEFQINEFDLLELRSLGKMPKMLKDTMRMKSKV